LINLFILDHNFWTRNELHNSQGRPAGWRAMFPIEKH